MLYSLSREVGEGTFFVRGIATPMVCLSIQADIITQPFALQFSAQQREPVAKWCFPPAHRSGGIVLSLKPNTSLRINCSMRSHWFAHPCPQLGCDSQPGPKSVDRRLEKSPKRGWQPDPSFSSLLFLRSPAYQTDPSRQYLRTRLTSSH